MLETTSKPKNTMNGEDKKMKQNEFKIDERKRVIAISEMWYVFCRRQASKN